MDARDPSEQTHVREGLMGVAVRVRIPEATAGEPVTRRECRVRELVPSGDDYEAGVRVSKPVPARAGENTTQSRLCAFPEPDSDPPQVLDLLGGCQPDHPLLDGVVNGAGQSQVLTRSLETLIGGFLLGPCVWVGATHHAHKAFLNQGLCLWTC